MKKYNIIYADPPWSYNDRSCSGNALKHYQTMRDEDIYNLNISDIADKDCVLFLWATYPKLAEALKCINAWGFKYKTIAFQWIKTNKNSNRLFFDKKSFFFGLGRWTRGNSECCLLATRGKPKRENNAISQLILSPLTRHSQKPEEARERVVKLLGDLPRIELFARQKAPGWDAWGNEVECDVEIGVVNGQASLS